MSFKIFLEKLQSFFETGNLDIPGKECQISEPIQRFVKICYLFEREIYKRAGDVTSSQCRDFCNLFMKCLTSPEISENFEIKVVTLDTRSREYLLRGFEYVSREFPNLYNPFYEKCLYY